MNNYIDYTMKLNEHSEYLKILNLLENKSKYIEYVLINNNKKDNKLKEFENDIISINRNNKWWGTISKKNRNIYIIKTSKKMFDYLKTFETFCKYYNTDKGDVSVLTDFGENDIAFFDDKDDPLLFTVTHEGYILIRKDVIGAINDKS